MAQIWTKIDPWSQGNLGEAQGVVRNNQEIKKRLFVPGPNVRLRGLRPPDISWTGPGWSRTQGDRFFPGQGRPSHGGVWGDDVLGNTRAPMRVMPPVASHTRGSYGCDVRPAPGCKNGLKLESATA